MVEFGTILKELRQRAGMTQKTACRPVVAVKGNSELL